MEHFFVRPDIESRSVRRTLEVRTRPYWIFMNHYGRQLGYHKLPHGTFWVARFRTTYQSYRQQRLGRADDTRRPDGSSVLSYDQAWGAASRWLQLPDHADVAAEPRRRGSNEDLAVCSIGAEFTIGHALHDYVEWKRLVAAKSNFPILVSLINFHIVPKLAALPVKDFTVEIVRQFMLDVVETPPRRGNQPPSSTRLSVNKLDFETLRKRKKTANSCLIILRTALRMAWENGQGSKPNVLGGL